MEELTAKAPQIFSIAGFPITNTLLASLISFIVLAVIGIIFRRKIRLIPGQFQNMVEIAVEGLLDFVNGIIQDREKTEKYFPLIATVFLFILISNWLGLIPGMGSIIVYGKEGAAPLLRSSASDLNFTLALGLISVVVTNLFGILAVGFWKHASKFVNIRSPLGFFVGILEFISEIAKIISFSFRLFGNVFAGEVLLTVMVSLLPYILPVPFLVLEVFVGFIQAFVFTMLTVVFLSMATLQSH